ncbi:MAG: hypothetical protein ACRCTD_08580 [Beijerinckiaceae bacterium]
MKIAFPFLALTLLACALSGCAYKPLKAPCSLDEGGTPIPYAAIERQPFSPAFAQLRDCGPLKPI